MAVFNGPPRPGSRGGRDQFSWENVKTDRDREYYLGHSVKALSGRWQKGKDVYWYTREKKHDGEDLDAELRAVKENEERLMAEALGLKPKSTIEGQCKLDQQDMKQLLQRTDSAAAGASDGTHIKGVGFSGQAIGGVPGRARLEGYDELGPSTSQPCYGHVVPCDKAAESMEGDGKRQRSKHEGLSGATLKRHKKEKKHKKEKQKSQKSHKHRKADDRSARHRSSSPGR